jgi:hypothetical protein
VQEGWQELDASSRRSNKMARNWRDLCPAVDCSGLIDDDDDDDDETHGENTVL